MLITSNHNNRLLCLKSKQAVYLTISNLHNIFMFHVSKQRYIFFKNGQSTFLHIEI